MKFNYLLLAAIATASILACSKEGTSNNPGENTGGDPEETTLYTENFAGYTGGVKSGYSAEESFTSTTTGVKWTLVCGCIDQTEDQAVFDGGHCFTLGGKAGKDDDGKSILYTSILTGGITKLSFDYVANASKVLEIQALVDGATVWTSGEITLTNNGQSNTKTPIHLEYDITKATKDVVLKFINVSEARRISIGNLSWNDAAGASGKASNGTEGDNGEGGGQGGNEDDEPTSTLTGNVTVSGDLVVEIDYYGDWYETGTNDCLIYIDNYETGEGIMSEFFTQLDTDDYSGTYTIDPEYSGAKNTALPAFIDEEGYMEGSWYYKMDENYEDFADYAAVASGTITLTKGSGDQYTIQVSFCDEFSHKISCSYTGEVDIYDGNDDSGYLTATKTTKSYSIRPLKRKIIFRSK